ncbi:MAG: FMN-binding protein [Bacteroidota bacterium]
MKKKQAMILVVLGVLTIGISIGAIWIKSFISSVAANHDKQIAAISISNVDLAIIPDGIYKGSYKVFPVAATVRVVVRDHKIVDIDLVEHKNGKGSAAEVIPNKVVETQKLEVDVITGATSSSKVILKAIENALSGAGKS